MTFEGLTYQAGEIDLSLASAPTISGRSDISGEAPLSLAARLWVMLSAHILSYFAKVKAAHPLAQIVIRHDASSEPSEPVILVTMNRRLRRKLARLRRLGRMAAPELTVHKPLEVNDLSHTQRLEKMILTRKWCRVRIFGLGLTRRQRLLHVWHFARLKGSVMNLQKALYCHAPLCPD